MTEEFFEERKEWSRWKHRLLERYLGQFAPIVGSTHQTVHFIDGFAGEGRYKSPPEDGSPVIAARIAKETPAARPYSLRCINIEPEGYKALCEATAPFGSQIVTNLEGTFREHLNTVLATIGSQDPALFFLDPLGHAGMEWDVVTRIIERARTGITEVLLNFFASKIDVHGGYLRSTERQAAKFVARLDALFGTTEWRPLWDGGADQPERIAKLTDFYQDRLTRAFAAASSHGITSRYAVKTLDGALKYYIMHGTRHPRGGRAMSESVYRVTMEYEDARAAAVKAALDAAPQTLLFGPEAPPTEEEIDESIVRGLVPDILALKPRLPRFTLAEIDEALLSKWFGRAIEKHFRRACIKLVEDKKAAVIPSVPSLPAKRRGRVVIDKKDSVVLL